MLDIKVGYSCNNSCCHCVVEPRRLSFKDSNNRENLTYSELVATIDNNMKSIEDVVVITGGEPTLRRDFGRLLNYIFSKSPNTCIHIQTNGRRLSNFKEDIVELVNNGCDLRFVVAIHGHTEELHNSIACSSTGNPFVETINSLMDLKNTLGDKFVFRTETVLSRKNFKNLLELCEFLKELGVKNIGISYPHLDGFYFMSEPHARKLAFSYEELMEYIPKFYEFIKTNQEIHFALEEFPRCIWRDSECNPLELLHNMHLTPDINRHDNTHVQFVETDAIEFGETFRKMRKYYDSCSDCVLKNTCAGVWEEVYYMFPNEKFIPLKGCDIKC